MGHTWTFLRAGGVDQVSLQTGADLLALRELDQKLWVALAMPTRDVDIDPRTLDLLDGDHDGRIRVPDVLAAIDWVAATWQEPGKILEGGDRLALSEVRDPKVQGAARRILQNLGKATDSISLADALDVVKALEATTLNGDGVVIPDSAEDADTRQAIEEVMAALGSVPDRSGKPGIDAAKAIAFFTAIDQLATWMKAGDEPAIRPVGDGTDAACDALGAVRAKLDDWFARSRLAAFDPRAGALVGGPETELAALVAKDLTSDSPDIARLPIARLDGGRGLPLRGAVNPAWADRLAAFHQQVVTPVLGHRDVLLPEDLATLSARMAPFVAWRAARPAVPVAALPADRVRALATGPTRQRIDERIAADLALSDDYAQITAVEKLLRYQRDLGRVIRNFVNFSDFYGKQDAAFQAGRLHLDGRAFRLCVPVSDAGKHAALASMSGAYLVYCDLGRGAVKTQIAAAITNGDVDNLFVGRNGIFYDRDGNDWDATIAKIVANPVSVRQAFWAPYKKLVRMIEDQVAKRAAAGEAASDARLNAAATDTAHVDKAAVATGETPGAPPAEKKIDVGTVAAIGVAVGGVGAMVVGILSAFFGLGLWMPVGLIALFMLISGPSMLLAWMKLRQRNLGPILDANGWAVNGRARINVAFGAALTDLAILPEGARRRLDDPYADKRSRWRLYLAIIVLVLVAATWYVGKLDRWLPTSMTRAEVIGPLASSNAPAATSSPASAATPSPAPAATPSPAEETK